MNHPTSRIDDFRRSALVKYFCKLGFDFATAEDLAHMTWERANEKKLSMDVLFGVALNIAHEAWKKHKTEKKQLSELKKIYLTNESGVDPSAMILQEEEEIERQRKLEMCNAFLKCLTEKERFVFKKKKIEGFSYEEIAKEIARIEELNTSQENLKQIVDNLRQTVRRALQKLRGEQDDTVRM